MGVLTQTLWQHGLVDELRLMVYPFFFGRATAPPATFATGDLEISARRLSRAARSPATIDQSADAGTGSPGPYIDEGGRGC